MIFVKLGYVMEGNVYRHMHVCVLCKTLYVLSVNVMYGIMGEDYLNVHSVQIFFVKMINLSIKPRVKYWNPKTTNVSIHFKTILPPFFNFNLSKILNILKCNFNKYSRQKVLAVLIHIFSKFMRGAVNSGRLLLCIQAVIFR